ncbi:hypothetical protein [Thermospira aquatica]|uniref:DUF5723 domain-containing protein n=1 Tax=Thermospira aquatica TaxID=2828656 RepID=A0AAX3BCK1_9SPIR|nr:hypothetical protein [Thermospira aquatica]URA09885.1 hypothetical protein KDW03_10425 [Thermospira aquatica]
MWRVLLVLCAVVLLWAEDGLLLGGWVRAGGGGVVQLDRNGTFSNWAYAGQTTWRLSAANLDTEYARFEFSGDLSLLQGVMTNLASSSIRWQVGEEAILTAELRKFLVMVKPWWGDVILGRQLVRWGEGVVFSPLDFFTSLDMMDVGLSRLGVDAVRVKIPLGQTGFGEAIGLVHSSWTNSTAGSRVGVAMGSWYTTLAAFYRGREKEWIGGVSLKGDLGPAWYTEVVYHHATNDKNSFWHGMIGMDYSWEKKWILRLEYATHTLETTNFTLFEQYTLPVYPFLSRHYASLQFLFLPTMIDTFSLTLVANLDDKETLWWQKGQWWIVSYTRNLYQNVHLLTWLRYQTDMAGIETERKGLWSFLVSVEVKY